MNETTKPRRTLKPAVIERLRNGEPPMGEPAAALGPLRPPSDKQSGFAARFWNRHLGAPVTVTLLNGEEVSGVLRWFDKYDVGVQIDGGEEILVAKHAVAIVKPEGRSRR